VDILSLCFHQFYIRLPLGPEEFSSVSLVEAQGGNRIEREDEVLVGRRRGRSLRRALVPLISKRGNQH
jgi:hypothetical protein